MKAINFTYEFLFDKNKNGEFKYIKTLRDNGLNPLYGKELYIPSTIVENRDYFFQSLGNLGAYGNNDFDSTIHYFLLPNETVDKLQFGIKDEVILSIEQICEDQKRKSKDPRKWRFNITFIHEHEVIDFITTRSKRINDDITLHLIEKYEKR